MACDCNTPTSSGGNTVPTERAYLTNPVTAPAESCYTPPENPCAVPVSRRRYLVDFIPGWLHRLTGAAKGKMLVAVGDTLHFFKGDRPGPLYFDGHDVSVGEQSTLTTKANEASVVERGHLTLAKKVRSGKVLPNGSVVDVDYFEHGVQSVREISSGEMVGLTSDPASGSVRLDVIEPTQRDLVKKGIPSGMRRLGFVETLIDGVCGKVPAKEFLSYIGGAFGASEILTGQNTGLPAVLVPTKKNDCGDWDYTLATQAFVESEGVNEEEYEGGDFRIAVIEPVYGDDECEGAITGFKTRHIVFPSILLTNGGYESIFPSESWIFEADATTTLAEASATIDVSGFVPSDARYAYIFAEVAATADNAVSGNNDARLTVHEAGDPDNFLFRLIASAPVALTVDYKTGMLTVPLNADKEFFISTYLVKDAPGTPAGCYVKLKLVGWKR